MISWGSLASCSKHCCLQATRYCLYPSLPFDSIAATSNFSLQDFTGTHAEPWHAFCETLMQLTPGLKDCETDSPTIQSGNLMLSVGQVCGNGTTRTACNEAACEPTKIERGMSVNLEGVSNHVIDKN